MSTSVGDIRVSLGDANLSASVATYRFRIPIEVTTTWLTRAEPDLITPALLTGSLETQLPTMRWIGPIAPQTIALRGYPTSENLDISLSNDQLMALEQRRGEGSVVLYLRLQATLLGPTAPAFAITQAEGPYSVEHSRWLGMLDQIGSEVSFLLRVPAPLTDLQLRESDTDDEDLASLSQASKRLRQARAEFASHEWEHCVATCRRVLENIGRLATFPSSASMASTAAKDRTQVQRWASIYHDLSSMASAAHHDDDTTDGFVWNRPDAEAILVTTAAFLARYGWGIGASTQP